MSVPVTDKEGRLVGIITIDDIVDVIEQEATEDIEIMAGITPTDKSYMKTGVIETWLKRVPWLAILMISGIFTSMIISHYEEALGTLVILTAFIPMLMSTGGNAGSQSSVAIIRAMSLDEIQPKNFFRVLFKEFRVSLLCGVCLAVVCFLKTMLLDLQCQFNPGNLKIALVVSLTTCAAVIVAKIIGTLLPIAAKKIKLDPAVMASPLITTLVDAISLIVYLLVAQSILPI